MWLVCKRAQKFFQELKPPVLCHYYRFILVTLLRMNKLELFYFILNSNTGRHTPQCRESQRSQTQTYTHLPCVCVRFHCYKAHSKYFNNCVCLHTVNTPTDIDVATGTTIGLLWRFSSSSTSAVTAAAGKQTSRATRRAGVGTTETTFICKLMNP